MPKRGPQNKGLGAPRKPVPLSSEQSTAYTVGLGRERAAERLTRLPGKFAKIVTTEKGEIRGLDIEQPFDVIIRNRRLSVQQLDAFFEGLMPSTIAPFAYVSDKLYDTNLGIGNYLTVLQRTVPDGTVWVITDVFFYGQGPGSGLNARPIELDPPSLAGLFRFQLQFNSRAATLGGAQVTSPYVVPNAELNRSYQEGWPFLERDIGPQRAGQQNAFYARSGEVVQVLAVLDAKPRFPVTKLGAHIHGFTMPEARFNETAKAGR